MESVHGDDVTTDPPPIREVCKAPYKVEPQLAAAVSQTHFQKILYKVAKVFKY